jgi:hypothetical protein
MDPASLTLLWLGLCTVGSGATLVLLALPWRGRVGVAAPEAQERR